MTLKNANYKWKVVSILVKILRVDPVIDKCLRFSYLIVSLRSIAHYRRFGLSVGPRCAIGRRSEYRVTAASTCKKLYRRLHSSLLHR